MAEFLELTRVSSEEGLRRAGAEDKTLDGRVFLSSAPPPFVRVSGKNFLIRKELKKTQRLRGGYKRAINTDNNQIGASANILSFSGQVSRR